MQQDFRTTIFHEALADENQTETALTLMDAQQVFTYFKTSPLFRWSDANNDCEDRANAICILLDDWGVVNCKAWVFSEYFLGKGFGSLTNRWNYHVAAAIPVIKENAIAYYVIDPSTLSAPADIDTWALQVTESGKSFHFIKRGHYYIFPTGKIEKENWHLRNKRNYNWTMQGLSGINGKSAIGKAQLAFRKKQVTETEEHFKKLKNQRPVF